ncbi:MULTISPECIES: hypothetical protein [Methylosinus]|uniref:hypothetical protein n=1 Tax=Methylosinus TaxID=425 RepID=UPI0012DC0BD0|nr:MULTISPECIES: hypothetical protein [Methylosinus]
MTDDAPEEPVLNSPTPSRTGELCATIARAKVADFWHPQFIPQADDPTATVTFFLVGGKI